MTDEACGGLTTIQESDRTLPASKRVAADIHRLADDGQRISSSVLALEAPNADAFFATALRMIASGEIPEVDDGFFRIIVRETGERLTLERGRRTWFLERHRQAA